MEKTFLLYLSVHWGDLIEQIKKICHIHFNHGLMNHEERDQTIDTDFKGVIMLVIPTCL